MITIPSVFARVNPTVRNVAVTALSTANRSVGGIVRKMERTSATLMKNLPGDGSVGGIIETVHTLPDIYGT
jgi:hypothetical protein